MKGTSDGVGCSAPALSGASEPTGMPMSASAVLVPSSVTSANKSRDSDQRKYQWLVARNEKETACHPSVCPRSEDKYAAGVGPRYRRCHKTRWRFGNKSYRISKSDATRASRPSEGYDQRF